MIQWIIMLDSGWLATRVHDKSARIERTSNPADAWSFGSEHTAREHAAWIRACRNEDAEVVTLERALRETGQMPDSIHEPAHYQSGDGSDIECIDTVRAMLTDDEYRGYLRGTLHTYLWRYKRKGGVEDLRKAQRYLTWLTEHEGRNR